MSPLSGLDAAFSWCCRRRRKAPADADIWHLWFHWPTAREDLAEQLAGNTYRLSAMQVTGRGREAKAVWSARDAVVLKWVALRLQDVLPVHPLCEHHRGHGGGKRSVQSMSRSLRREGWQYVCRTDIQGFYGHIRRGPLMRQLKRHVHDPVLLNLIRQYLHYSVERGGEFHTPEKGICRGCALSPLLAGFCLWAMDTYFEAQPSVRYVRFMDDIVILSRTRWRLRRAVRALNVFFASGGYRQHPEKTFIGRTGKGFDWMGIMFNRSGIVGVAPRALANHRERCRRLYEQVWRYGQKQTRARVSAYVKRWTIWRESMMSTRNPRETHGAVSPVSGRRGWVVAGLLAAGYLLGPGVAQAATPSCYNAPDGVYPSSGTPSPMFAPPTKTPGLYPPYALLAQIGIAGGSKTCMLPPGTEKIALYTGVVTDTQSLRWQNMGPGITMQSSRGMTYGAATNNGYNNCNPIDNNPANSVLSYCARYQITPPNLVCTDDNGSHTTTTGSSGLSSRYGGVVQVIPCANRLDGTGVTLSFGTLQIAIYSSSPDGLIPLLSDSGEPTGVQGDANTNQRGWLSPPGIALAYLTSNSSVPTDLSNLRVCTPNTYANCQSSSVSIIGTRLTGQPDAVLRCTAVTSVNQLDWGTVTPDMTGQVPGQALSGGGIGKKTVGLTLQCTDGGDQVNAIQISPRGTSATGFSDVFASTNDSVGYALEYGTAKKKKLGVNLSDVSSPVTDRWTVVTPDTTWTTDLDVTPVALLPELIPGTATTTVTLDIYAGTQ